MTGGSLGARVQMIPEVELPGGAAIESHLPPLASMGAMHAARAGAYSFTFQPLYARGDWQSCNRALPVSVSRDLVSRIPSYQLGRVSVMHGAVVGQHTCSRMHASC
jgi:hypothetical protein